MKNILFASTAALALVACGANEVEVAEVETPVERTVVLSETTTADAMMPAKDMLPTPRMISLSNLLNADIFGAEGTEFTDVEDVYVRDGRIQGISFDADAAFGGKRYAEFANLEFRHEDNHEDLDVIIDRTEDSFDDFDLIDENVEITFGDVGTDLLEADVMVAGLDGTAEIEEIWFNTDGTVAYFMVDTGILDAPEKVMPGLVTFTGYDGFNTTSDVTLQERMEVLGEVEYDDSDDSDAYTYESTDYDPDRK